MGFECGFNKIRKFKDFSLEKIINIKNYLHFKNLVDCLGDGEQHSYKEYWHMYCHDYDCTFPGIPSEEDVNDYLALINNEDIEQNIYYWGSRGREYLDYNILCCDSVQRTNIDEVFNVDASFVTEAREWLNDNFNDCNLTPAVIKRGFKNVSNNSTVISWLDVDGIQVEDANDEYSKAMINKDTIIYIPTINFDLDQYETLKSFELVLNALEKINFDDYYITYYKSY